jgi:hypothetical protein
LESTQFFFVMYLEGTLYLKHYFKKQDGSFAHSLKMEGILHLLVSLTSLLLSRSTCENLLTPTPHDLHMFSFMRTIVTCVIGPIKRIFEMGNGTPFLKV